MIYTPPEPAAYMAGQDGSESVFTEAQLRSEVERVRRETVEECARKLPMFIGKWQAIKPPTQSPEEFIVDCFFDMTRSLK